MAFTVEDKNVIKLLRQTTVGKDVSGKIVETWRTKSS